MEWTPPFSTGIEMPKWRRIVDPGRATASTVSYLHGARMPAAGAEGKDVVGVMRCMSFAGAGLRDYVAQLPHDNRLNSGLDVIHFSW